jgi:phytoene synthase
MKEIYDSVSIACSKQTTRAYSTSFSLGIYCLDSRLRNPIYSIYGFVRFADEIVDSFHGYNKIELLTEFKEETWKAIDRKISLNPILNSFQHVVHKYNISRELIERFLQSMESDLTVNEHSKDSYNQYIYGSAEVVGLMCLSVFTENNVELYQQLKQPAMKLGAAFQKINFLRDIKNDYSDLGRMYFPGIDFTSFTETDKKQIELEIKQDFEEALVGIKKLPKSSKLGVYVAYIYYENLFTKIVDIPSASILMQRVRISNPKKMRLLFTSYLKHNLSLI